jgi:hypothetical protein
MTIKSCFGSNGSKETKQCTHGYHCRYLRIDEIMTHQSTLLPMDVERETQGSVDVASLELLRPVRSATSPIPGEIRHEKLFV